MLRTGIPVSVWEAEGEAVLATAIEMIAADDADDEPQRPAGIDPFDPSTLPEGWRA